MLCYLIIMFFTNSCSPLKFTTTEPKQPRQEYYSLSKEVNTETGGIDTSSIYERDWVGTGDYGTKKEYLYVFMKFGNNGIAYYSNYTEYPFTESSVLSIGGQYCHYKVSNDVLQLEFYDHLAKHFKIWHAKIYPDKLQFYEYKLRVAAGAKGKLNFTFNKTPVKYTRLLTWPE
jgi:hypothetical protein